MVAPPLRSATIAGPELSALLADEYDELALRCRAPVTACGPWLAATVSGVDERQLWAAVVRDSDEVLRACVILLEAESAGVPLVSLAGSAMGFRSAVLADGAAAAALLGHEFGESLQARSGAVDVELGPIDSDTPWVAEFAATVPGAEVVPIDPIPSVRRLGSCDIQQYLSASMMRTLRKAANRAETDRKRLFVRITRELDEIIDMLPELEQVHRERDHAKGRRSELDDAIGRRIWAARIVALATERTLELATLHIDGDLAAHVLAIVEPPAYRVLEGNLATRWARYAPGRVLEAAILQRALDEPSIDYLDWMSAAAAEHLLAANDVQPVSVIRVNYPSGRQR